MVSEKLDKFNKKFWITKGISKERRKELLTIMGIISNSKNIRSVYKEYADKGEHFCACGCGQPLKKLNNYPFYSKYISGHNNGRKYLEPRDLLIDAPLCACGCGQKVSRMKGRKYKWNKFILGHFTKGRTLEQSLGEEKADIYRKRLIERNKKNNCMWKSEPRKRKSDSMIDWEFYNKYGCKRSSVPYTDEFNPQLKKQITERDSFTCQLFTELLPDKFAVHHIDYEKKNCNPINLIFLCNSCHTKTNHNRDFWQNYFQSYQIERGVINECRKA